MRVDATTVRLRTRSMNEAMDLGVRLVQAHYGTLLRTALPVLAAAVLLVQLLQPLGWWAPWLALWWAKPWLDRAVLFVLARSLFGQPTRARDLLARGGPLGWRTLPSSLIQRRLSPWRAFTQPVVQLEGQRGSALRARKAQIRRGHAGAALSLGLAFWFLETALGTGIPALWVWLVPEATLSDFWVWTAESEGSLSVLAMNLSFGLAVLIVEPFYVGAGFGMYLNRRVQLEAWDVEQALRHAFAAA
jgi:hypothetical protein